LWITCISFVLLFLYHFPTMLNCKVRCNGATPSNSSTHMLQ
jgi:hypothetical protein